jgi:hypothetical protein
MEIKPALLSVASIREVVLMLHVSLQIFSRHKNTNNDNNVKYNLKQGEQRKRREMQCPLGSGFVGVDGLLVRHHNVPERVVTTQAKETVRGAD